MVLPGWRLWYGLALKITLVCAVLALPPLGWGDQLFWVWTADYVVASVYFWVGFIQWNEEVIRRWR